MSPSLGDDLDGVVFHCRADAEWTIAHVSPGYARLAGRLGRAAPRSAPLTYRNFIDREEGAEPCFEAHQRIASHLPFTRTYGIVVGGSHKHVLERTHGVYGAAGRLVGVVGRLFELDGPLSCAQGVCEDDRLKLFGPLLDHAPFPIYMVSSDDRMLLTNPSFNQFVQVPENASGRRLDELFGGPMAAIFHEQNLRVIEAEAPLELDEVVERPGGDLRHFRTVKFPVWDERRGRHVVGGISLDITGLVEATRALEVDRKSFELIANTVPQVVWTADVHGSLAYCNDAFVRVAALPREEALGGSWTRLVHPDGKERVEAAWQQSLATGMPFESTCCLGAPGRAYRWHLVRALTMGRPGQPGTRWFGTCTDIDERWYEEEEHRFLAEGRRWLLGHALDVDVLLEGLPGLLVPNRFDGVVLLLTADASQGPRVEVAHRDPARRAAAMALRDALQANTSLEGLWSASLQTSHEEVLEDVTPALLAERVPDPTSRAKHEALGIRSALVLPLLAHGRRLGGLMLFRGDAPRPFRPSERAAARDLAENIALLGVHAATHASLREAVDLRDEFISVAAHELRTPLTGLLLRQQQLGRFLGELSTSRAPDEETLSRICGSLHSSTHQARRLTRLITQLLDTARIRGGLLVLERKRVDLGALVRTVLEGHALELARTGHVVTFEERSPACGLWDEGRLEQVLSNLLTNAMKFGGGRPILVWLDRSPDLENARVHVRDRGMGIDPSMQKVIFERFERAVSGRAYGGLGLGLFICQAIIRAHGGRIGVESNLGEGAEFWFDLPLADAR